MHPDKKVGFALAILLIGIVGAFFFRNEVPEPNQAAPALASGSELDKRIRHQHHAPYLPEAEKAKSQLDVPVITDVFAENVLPRVPGTASVPEPIRVDGSRPNAAPLSGTHQSPEGPKSVSSNTSSTTILRPLEGKGSGLHEVVAGDTLSSIALKYLGTNRRYLEVYEFNKDVLRSPNDLRLGMKLKIPGSETVVVPQRPAASSTTSMSTPETGSSPLPPTPPPESGEPQPASSPSEPPPKPSFVRPKSSPVRPPARSSKSLTQAAPPGLPSVEGLDPRRDPSVLASRPKPDAN